MQQIQLNQGRVVTMDDEDFNRLSDYHWCYRPERNGKQGYAIRHDRTDGKSKTVYLHRQIMKPPQGYEVIFKNYDRLDCRRENLAIATKEDARRHHRVRSDSKSGIKGVRFNPVGETWTATIYRYGHCYTIGTFNSEEQATQAYEAELRRENAELYDAPAVVERQLEPTKKNEVREQDLA